MSVHLNLTQGAALTNAVDNDALPRHRWYSIKEGFSANLVRKSFSQLEAAQRETALAIEPFSGSGTTLVECARMGVNCLAFEVNPFLAFVSRTKIRQVEPKRLKKARDMILSGLAHPRKSHLENISTFCESTDRDKSLFNKSVLRAFAGGWKATEGCAPSQRPFFRLALVRAAMDNCNAYPDGKCLRYKRLDNYDEFNPEALTARFTEYCKIIEEDLEGNPLSGIGSEVRCMDSRGLATHKAGHRFDFCVTSPPYLNSFDYSDVYRPELFLTSAVTNNAELMRIRLQTVRSHVQANWKAPQKSKFGAIYDKCVKELQGNLEKLWSTKIPLMIQAYFEDMEKLLTALAARAKPKALMKIAVGTSAYGGVVVPVDLILADIAEAAGWQLTEVQVIRRLRSSPQLWKHEDNEQKVPALRESIVVLRMPEK